MVALRELFSMLACLTPMPHPTGIQQSSRYGNHENQKKWAYDQRIREVEHVTFTPLVLSTGGLARQAAVFYKRLANLLSSKINQPYTKTINWLRC